MEQQKTFSGIRVKKITWKACATIVDVRAAERLLHKLGFRFNTSPKIYDGELWVTTVKEPVSNNNKGDF
jgi:hypothetical protein